MEEPLYVHASWDAEAEVWVASSEDVPGLVTEAATAEELVTKLKMMIPELLEMNGINRARPIPFELLSRRFDVAA